MANESHERSVCLVAAQAFARRRAGGEFVVDGYPDERERTEEAVDVIGHDSQGPVTIEHTLIEAYDNQVLENKRFAQLFQGFSERFGARLPQPGYYSLAVDLGAIGVARGYTVDLPDTIEAWVWAEAASLLEPRIPPVGLNHVQVELSGPIPVTLYRLRDGPGEEGSLSVALLFPGDIEAERTARIRTALDKKVRKLEAARLPGGKTLLVLESQDFVLSNPVVIAQAVHAAAQGLTPMPDEIVCIDVSAGEGGWREYPIKLGDRWSAAALDLP
jgi:hypothetical protein